jgi:hypothetical protein
VVKVLTRLEAMITTSRAPTNISKTKLVENRGNGSKRRNRLLPPLVGFKKTVGPGQRLNLL